MILISRCEIDPASFVMEVRAKSAIREKEEITTRYFGPWEGQPSRQLKIGQNWNFVCNCLRCKDPSDLGTYFSAIVCPNCSTQMTCTGSSETDSNSSLKYHNSNHYGYLLPIDCQLLGTPWQCQSCGQKKCVSDIQSILKDVEATMDSIKKDILEKMNEDGSNIVNRIKSYTDQIQTSIHPNHFLLFQFKKWITDLSISKPATEQVIIEEQNKHNSKDNGMSDISTKIGFLELQQRYHMDLLIIIELLDPGFTLNRAGHIKKVALIRMQLSHLKMTANPENYTNVHHMAQMKIAISELKLVSESFKYPEMKCVPKFNVKNGR